MSQRIAVELLSGGEDSKKVFKWLIEKGYKVIPLCVGGKEGKEVPGAQKVVDEYNKKVADADKIQLRVKQLGWLEEKTYSFVQLLWRDLIMLVWAVRTALKYKAEAIATGTKASDTDLRRCWFPPFHLFCWSVLWLLGIKVLVPIWRNK
jgi:7-cyano-7-deazaguanine synthase in queuosine biosynthesis